MPSKFSNYKQVLRRHLVCLKWEKDESLEWLNKHSNLVHTYFDMKCPAFEAARLIDTYHKE